MADEQDLFERDLILNELQRVLNLVETDELQFKSRTKDLAGQQRKFSKLQSKIEKALIKSKHFDKDEQLKLRNNFNDCFYAIQVHVDRLKSEDEERIRVRRSLDASFRSVQASNNNSFSHGQNSRLPTLPLPSFSGESTDWPSFYDLFMSLVHGNSGYTDAEKFRYLLLTLKEEPFNLIKSIPITDENYLVALQILISRYQNKRAIATKHFDRILDIEPCTDDTHLSLRRLLNIYQENIKALEMMKFPIDKWDFILMNILLRKISLSTRKRFEFSLLKPNEIPSVSVLLNFLEREVAACEISAEYERTSQGSPPPQAARYSFVASVVQGPSAGHSKPYDDRVRRCVMCEGSHLLTKCSQFLSLIQMDRYYSIRKENVCLNCLSVGHKVRQCKSRFACRFCQRRHHSLLHFPDQQSLAVFSDKKAGSADSLTPMLDVPMPVSAAVADSFHAADDISAEYSARGPEVSASLTHAQTVLLPTALIDVYVDGQKKSTLRCLIDSGSQSSFITKACAQKLRLPSRKVDVPMCGLGDTNSVHLRDLVSFSVAPTNLDGPSIPVNALLLPKLVSQMPSVPLPRVKWPHLEHLMLADSTFCTPQPVDILLGADVLPQILLGNIITGKPGSPTALNTVFGYVLFGNVSMSSGELNPLRACFNSCFSAEECFMKPCV